MTPREELARALRLAYADAVPASAAHIEHSPWETLPHERQRKWLELAAAAERNIARRDSVRFAAVIAAVGEIDALDARDAEKAHVRVDEILREFAPVEVANAVTRLVARAPWWAGA